MSKRLMLDGGLATELEARGFDLSVGSLWSARLIVSDPVAIRDVHADYLAAGADIITSATYQASVAGICREFGVSVDRATQIVREGVRIAVAERDAFCEISESRQRMSRPMVAASIGPYGAFLADGSEYFGNYAVDAAEIEKFHKAQVTCMRSTAADVLAFETVPDLTESRAIAKVMQMPENADVAFWVSFQCRSPTESAQTQQGVIASGDSLESICYDLLSLSATGHLKNLWGLGVNCVEPQAIQLLTSCISRAKMRVLSASATEEKERTRIEQIHILSYPNSGEVYDPQSKVWSWPEDPYFGTRALKRVDPTNHDRACVKRWTSLQIESQADVLGGCCRTGPLHIASLLHSSIL